MRRILPSSDVLLQTHIPANMNDTTPTDSPASPENTNEPTVPATENKAAEAPAEPAPEPAPAEAKSAAEAPVAPAEASAAPAEDSAAEAKAEPGSGGKPALDAAKEKARAAAEAIKAHDFKGDARKAAAGAKRLWNDLRKHDYKAEIRETFAKAKKDPSSLWKKPETPRPGKDLAVAGLAVAVAGLFLLLVTSGAFVGVVCLFLGLVALLAGVLGLGTEGRSFAFAGACAGILAVAMSIGQIHSATRKPDPKDELIRLLSAQLAQASAQSVSKKDVADLLTRLEEAKSGRSKQSPEDLAKAVSALDSLTSTLKGEAAEAVASGLGRLFAGESDPEGSEAAQEVASGVGRLLVGGSDTDAVGAAGAVASGLGKLFGVGFGPAGGEGDSFEATRARVAGDPSLAVRPLPDSMDPRKVARPVSKMDNPAWGQGADGQTGGKKKDMFGREIRTPDDEPPAGPSSARNKEAQQVLKKAKIETMTVDLPNKTGLLLTKLPDGTYMGTFEVTQDQWLSVMGGENPSAEDNVGDDRPVDSIWPDDALEFVDKLNRLSSVREAGLQFRIPAEEEWEKACLAGNKKSRDFGLRLDGEKVSAKNFGDVAWFRGNMTRPADVGPYEQHPGISHSVGRKQPNAFGLYDMHGNVAELTFGKDPGVAPFRAKGGYWADGNDACNAYETMHHVMEEPPAKYSGAKQPTNFSLGFRVAAVLDKDVVRILVAGEKASEKGGVSFYGFRPGMSEADALHLANYYGLVVEELETRGRDELYTPGRCQFEVVPETKSVAQIRFDFQAIRAITKKFKKPSDPGYFETLFSSLSKYAGNLECIRDGREGRGKNSLPEDYLYRRTAPGGLAVVLQESVDRSPILLLEDAVAANNARIAKVEPLLKKGGIETRILKLPGGVKLLLSKLPDDRFLGTFEVTQAQYESLTGKNASHHVGATLPADPVSMQDCLDFIAKANELPAVKEAELRFRLPSRAEWETARHAGAAGDSARMLDGTTKDVSAKAAVAYEPVDPKPVGSSAPNAFGLCDLSGDAKEWGSGEVRKVVLVGDGGRSKPLLDGGFRVSVVSWPREIRRAKELAAKKYPFSNNGRIDAVKPVLTKAGIQTKEIELPDGFRMLLSKLPDGSWAGTFEVTQGQWKSLLHDNPASFRGEVPTDDVILEIWRSWKDKNPENLCGTGLPVDQMSPGDIGAFLVRLNMLPSVREAGLHFHLPTMDEWLYAARAWAENKFAPPLGGGDASVNRMGWHGGNVEGAPRLQIVGQKQPNIFGLYDVHGNVAELAESKYGGGGTGCHALGGSVKAAKGADCALERPIADFGDHTVFNGPKTFNGFRVVATEGGRPHLVDPAMAAQSNARIDEVKPELDAKGIKTKILDLPGGVKLLLNRLPAGEWVGAFEVTQAQFLSVLGENPSVISYRAFTMGEALAGLAAIDNGMAPRTHSKNDVAVFESPWTYRTGGGPVDSVTREAAEAFVDALNELPCAKEAGLEFHLPTLDQWRSSVSDWNGDAETVSFPTLPELQKRAWIAGESWESVPVRGMTRKEAEQRRAAVGPIQLWAHPVGERQPNSYGLYDTIGNVQEWTSSEKEISEKTLERLRNADKDQWYIKNFVAGRHYAVGGSYNSQFCKDEKTGACSVKMINDLAPKDDLGDVGLRVWARPAAPASSGSPSRRAAISRFARSNNARIDAAKPVLAAAGIETREFELPNGARILMNKLPNGAWMAAFETTQAQFCFADGILNPSRIKGGDLPVDGVSWNDATIVASFLNELPVVKAAGFHFRLPTSEEWEFACRGGGTGPLGKPLEKGRGKLDDMVWYEKNSDIEGVLLAHRVGELQPNAFGLYDMLGNVAEWTETAVSSPEDGSSRRNSSSKEGSKKILRGGGWNSPKEHCTAGWSGLLPSDAARPDTGFRLYATQD